MGVVDTTSPIQSQINNLVNTKASQTDVNLLNTRVNNIIANAGDDNTEIVDARVSVDGTTYTVLKDRLDTEHTQLKSAINANAASITNLSSHKVNIPLDDNSQPTNGTNGQTLRTKGNGATEWADVGLPTDEQTAQAVSDWLDDHPEATTTVDFAIVTKVFPNVTRMLEDLTLAEGDTVRTLGYYSVNDGGAALYHVMGAAPVDDYYETLQNGLIAVLVVKGAVNVKTLGAHGDGESDDSSIIQFALDNYDNVYVPNGVFSISQTLTITTRTGKKFVVDGDIVYSGADAAIDIADTLYATIYVGKITALNGSCVKLSASNALCEFNEIHSTYLRGKKCIDVISNNGYAVQYVNIYSGYLVATEIAISFTNENTSSWNGEIKFFGGEVQGRNAVGVYARRCTALRMFGVSFEQLLNLCDIADSGHITMYGMRSEQAGKIILSGKIYVAIFDGDIFKISDIDTSGLTENSGISFIGAIRTSSGADIGSKWEVTGDQIGYTSGGMRDNQAFWYLGAPGSIGTGGRQPRIARITAAGVYTLPKSYSVGAREEIIIYAEKAGIIIKNHNESKTILETTDAQSVWRITAANTNSYFSPSGYIVEKITPYKQT